MHHPALKKNLLKVDEKRAVSVHVVVGDVHLVKLRRWRKSVCECDDARGMFCEESFEGVETVGGL